MMSASIWHGALAMVIHKHGATPDEQRLARILDDVIILIEKGHETDAITEYLNKRLAWLLDQQDQGEQA